MWVGTPLWVAIPGRTRFVRPFENTASSKSLNMFSTARKIIILSLEKSLGINSNFSKNADKKQLQQKQLHHLRHPGRSVQHQIFCAWSHLEIHRTCSCSNSELVGELQLPWSNVGTFFPWKGMSHPTHNGAFYLPFFLPRSLKMV